MSVRRVMGIESEFGISNPRDSSANPMLLSIFRPSVQPYMISWLSYDPQVLMRSQNPVATKGGRIPR